MPYLNKYFQNAFLFRQVNFMVSPFFFRRQSQAIRQGQVPADGLGPKQAISRQTEVSCFPPSARVFTL